jgi:hypothetical protein
MVHHTKEHVKTVYSTEIDKLKKFYSKHSEADKEVYLIEHEEKVR